MPEVKVTTESGYIRTQNTARNAERRYGQHPRKYSNAGEDRIIKGKLIRNEQPSYIEEIAIRMLMGGGARIYCSIAWCKLTLYGDEYYRVPGSNYGTVDAVKKQVAKSGQTLTDDTVEQANSWLTAMEMGVDN